MKLDLLHDIYPKEEIFIINYTFNDENRAIEVICQVPPAYTYGLKLVKYVTTENYVRCLSQACYLLAERLLAKKLIMVDISVEEYSEAAKNWKVYYRTLKTYFHVMVPKGEQFTIRLSLQNYRQVTGIHNLLLFTFIIDRTVISGEMSFVIENS